MKLTPSLQPCGTYAAYQRHVKAGESPCVGCRQASAEYRRTYRERRMPGDGRAVRRQYARDRALRRLAARHHAELDTLVAEELRRSEAEVTSQ